MGFSVANEDSIVIKDTRKKSNSIASHLYNFIIIFFTGTSAEQTVSAASSEEQQTFGERAYKFFSRPWRSSNTEAIENDSISSSNTSINTDSEAGNPSNPPPIASSPRSTSAATVPIAERSSSRSALDIEGGEIESSGSGDSVSRTTTTPVCLICLEALAPEDFANGRAISLGCKCRGDMGLRHKDCAQKWAQVKDSGRGGVPVCELCKQPASNLPPIPPRPHLLRPDTSTTAAGGVSPEDLYNEQMAFATFAPSAADLVFDCIRVTWVAMIVSILFFEASLASALSTGMIAGAAYAISVRIMYRQHFEAMRAYANENGAAAPPPPQVPVNVV